MTQRTVWFAAVLVLFLSTSLSAASNKRSYVSGNFALELDGAPAGFVSGVDGGFAAGSVVEELTTSPEYFVKKHLEDPPGYQDITLEFGLGMSPTFFQWMRDALNGIPTRKNGALVALDFQLKIVRRLNFVNAQITRITFPRLDGVSKEPAKIRITLTPESTNVAAGGGTWKGSTSKQKVWVASNFKLGIPTVNSTKISAVESIDIDLPHTPAIEICPSECDQRFAKINFPNLEVVMAETTSADWAAWHQSFVIAGQHNDSDEKSGTLDFLDGTQKNVLFSLTFTGLGIISVANEPVGASGDAIARVRATMYVEQITMTPVTGLP
jgi:hypothetical protein